MRIRDWSSDVCSSDLCPTGPAVWGMPGTDAQHTFFQWLHQGTDGAPVDFIVSQDADHGWAEHHQSLLANCLAQREALLNGKTYDEALKECMDAGVPRETAEGLARHRGNPGGRPDRKSDVSGKEVGVRVELG